MPNINAHICLDPECRVCHPGRSGGGVDKSVENPGGGVDNSAPVVDNLPDVEPWEDSPAIEVEAPVAAGDPEISAAYLDRQRNGLFYYAMFLEVKLGEARSLIEWYSKKWGEDYDPLFPWRDEYTRQDLPGNRKLADTWYELVRGGTVCETCEGTRGVRTPTEQERVFTFTPCEVCGGRGFFPKGETV